MDAIAHRIAAPAAPSSNAEVIHLRGEIDLASASLVSIRLSRAATGRTDELVIDLSQVTFMDCAGLRPVIAARDRAPGRMWLQHPSGPVRHLLDVTGLWSKFSVVERSGDATDELELRVARLQEEIRSRAAIEQAKGLLMGIHRCSANRAFERLTKASQDHNVRVRDICDALTADAAGRSACPPGADVAAAMRAAMRVTVDPIR